MNLKLVKQITFVVMIAALTTGQILAAEHPLDEMVGQVRFDPVYPKTSIDQALADARGIALEKGYALDTFRIMTVYYDYKLKLWDIYFENRILGPVEHFSVTLNELTGEKKLNGKINT